ncbi:MAG: hypothetical protein GXY25_08935 [Pirellulaceae bacterium]|jgi:hypothetical protein|nr:hypothetical protein [Thermoguttaceae bacterium]NLZ00645.1 hypothetical protein [Pirellulaceae bacterium]
MTRQRLGEVKDKVGEAAEVTRKFTSQEMQAYGDSLKNKLQELDTQREQ